MPNDRPNDPDAPKVPLRFLGPHGEDLRDPGRKPHPNEDDHPRMVRATERERLVYDLRTRGKSFRQIAAETQIGLKEVHESWTRALKKFREEVAETVKQAREVQLERLDTAIAAIMDAVEEGDLKAIETMIKLEDRRAKLLGLDVNKWPEDASGAPKAPGVNLAAVPTENLAEILRLAGVEDEE